MIANRIKIIMVSFFLAFGISADFAAAQSAGEYLQIPGDGMADFMFRISEFENPKAYSETMIINFTSQFSTSATMHTLSIIAKNNEDEAVIGFEGKKFFIGDVCLLAFNIDSNLPHATPWMDAPLILIKIPALNCRMKAKGTCSIKVNHCDKELYYTLTKKSDTYSPQGITYKPSQLLASGYSFESEIQRRKASNIKDIFSQNGTLTLYLKHPGIAGMYLKMKLDGNGGVEEVLIEKGKTVFEAKLRYSVYKNFDGETEVIFETITPMAESYCVIRNIRLDKKTIRGKGYYYHNSEFPRVIKTLFEGTFEVPAY
jgi:hypothetical protein